jgi:uncharacterized protein (UPF0303 family)
MVNGEFYQFELNYNTAYLIGALFGDGCISNGAIRFRVKDYKFAWKISRIIKAEFKKNNHPLQVIENGEITFLIQYCSKLVAPIFEGSLIYIENCKDKLILSAFLCGCFDAEGCVDKKRLRVRFVNKKKYYALLVSKSLNTLKIKHKLNLDKYGLFEIAIYGLKDITKFSKYVRFSIKKRQSRLINLTQKDMKKINKSQNGNKNYQIVTPKYSMKQFKKLYRKGLV